MKQIKKLQLNKETVAKLKKDETLNIFGGVLITGSITQGPGCRSVNQICQQETRTNPPANPITSYCASGYPKTCNNRIPTVCGTDIWC